jgi:hypothetical protein
MVKEISVNNWWKFQHYKERRPVWVKLHVTYLEDKKHWPAEQRLIALLLMIVAANKDNRFTSDPRWLSYELGLPVAAVRRAVSGLLEDGFLRDADGVDSEQPKVVNADVPASNEDSPDACTEARLTCVSSPLLALTKDEGIPKGTKTNPLWDALVEHVVQLPDGAELTETAKSLLGKSVRELRQVGATPYEVARRAAAYRKHWPNADLTARALSKWWPDAGRWADEDEAVASAPYPGWVDDMPSEVQEIIREFPAAVCWGSVPGMLSPDEIGSLDPVHLRNKLRDKAAK